MEPFTSSQKRPTNSGLTEAATDRQWNFSILWGTMSPGSQGDDAGALFPSNPCPHWLVESGVTSPSTTIPTGSLPTLPLQQLPASKSS